MEYNLNILNVLCVFVSSFSCIHTHTYTTTTQRRRNIFGSSKISNDTLNISICRYYRDNDDVHICVYKVLFSYRIDVAFCQFLCLCIYIYIYNSRLRDGSDAHKKIIFTLYFQCGTNNSFISRAIFFLPSRRASSLPHGLFIKLVLYIVLNVAPSPLQKLLWVGKSYYLHTYIYYFYIISFCLISIGNKAY